MSRSNTFVLPFTSFVTSVGRGNGKRDRKVVDDPKSTADSQTVVDGKSGKAAKDAKVKAAAEAKAAKAAAAKAAASTKAASAKAAKAEKARSQAGSTVKVAQVVPKKGDAGSTKPTDALPTVDDSKVDGMSCENIFQQTISYFLKVYPRTSMARTSPPVFATMLQLAVLTMRTI